MATLGEESSALQPSIIYRAVHQRTRESSTYYAAQHSKLPCRHMGETACRLPTMLRCSQPASLLQAALTPAAPPSDTIRPFSTPRRRRLALGPWWLA